MKFKPVPTAKRQVITTRGWSNFESFYHGLRVSDQNEIYKWLPEVDGFRRGTSAGNKKRLEEYFRHLATKEGSRESGRAWKVYPSIFSHWILSRPDLNSLLLAFDNDADFIGHADGMPPNTELDLACFAMLSEASRRGEITKEDITAFYDYGYFVVDDRIEHDIHLATPEKEARVIRELRVLPAKLDTLRADVGVLAERTDVVDRVAGQHAAKLGRVDDRLSTVEEQLSALAGPTDNEFIQNALISKADADTVRDIEAIVNLLTETVSGLAERIDHLVQSNDTEDGNAGNPQRFVDIASAIEGAESQATAAQRQAHDLHVAMEETAATLRGEMQGVVAETQSRSERAIDARMAELREEIARQASDTAPITTNNESHHVTAIQTLTANSLVPVEVFAWPQGATIVDHLEHNAQRAGLVPRSARSLAREVLAGLGAGQLVTFRGSVASLIAEVCAQTIAAQSTYVTRIPVGMLSDDELGHILDSFAAESQRGDGLRLLAIEGLNRSALEVFGGSLSSLVGRRLLNLGVSAPRLCLLGTVVDGPSALPIVSALCELGPILDVDALDWSSKGSQGLVEATSVPSPVWDSHIGAIRQATRPQQIVDVLEELGSTSILWRRCLTTAYSHLSALSGDGGPSHALASLAFGWIVPYALARGISPEPLVRALLSDDNHESEDSRIERLVDRWLSAGGVS